MKTKLIIIVKQVPVPAFHNAVKAVYWWNEAVKQGYTPAYNSMGIAYMLGLGVDIDLIKARDYLKKGAESGDAKAQCNYGDLYRDGVKIHTGSLSLKNHNIYMDIIMVQKT